MPRCALCGEPFEAKRSTKRYCSASCRARASQGATPVTDLPRPTANGVEAATRAELDAADRLDTALGQAALALARRVDSDRETGASAAAVTKEWRTVMTEALKGAGAAASPLDRARDELARRRAARGA